MIVFIKKILVFLVLALAALAVIVLIPSEITKSKSSFKIDNNAKHVVFGHSHSSYAYNDSIIANFQNLADAGESYFYTYQKVKNIIPNNPQIETIFIEYANNQIDIKMDEWIWGYEKMSYFLPLYAPFINKEDLELLYTMNSQDLSGCLSLSAKNNIKRLATSSFNIINDIDGYKWTKINKIDEMIEDSKSDSTDFGIDYKVSETNINYLRKIIDFCKENNKQVFLIRSPQHPSLPVLKNEYHYQKIKKDILNDVDLLDFNSFIVPNEYYVDLDHLNYKGADLFSNMIDDLLNKNLLNNANKAQQIKEALLIYSLTQLNI